jgi:RNA polymerase sigma-70 factor (ECF subfamily)
MTATARALPLSGIVGEVTESAGSSARDRRRDRRLARGLRKQDPKALAALQQQYGGIVLGFLTNLLGDRASAEDVLQVTLLEVWQRGPSYDPERASLLTWMLMIARSRGLDQLRRRVPEPHDPATATAVLDRDAAAATGSETDALLDRWQVAGLLTRLPPAEAEMLRMRFHRGLTQREIADRTGVPLGTVKMRMVQALGRLRDLLDEEERTR